MKPLRPAHRFEIDPSGRPLKRAGFEAAFALGLVALWFVLIMVVFAIMGKDQSDDHVWPTVSLLGIGALCWYGAEVVVGRHALIWPGSAFGVLGPLSVGFAVALSTEELRVGHPLIQVAIVAAVAGLCMIPFLVRFRLPGLVSPIITFLLTGVFLSLFDADPSRIRQLEGFSPRGIVAALMGDWRSATLFGLAALAGAVYARRLDLSADNFGLAAARPLHLIGGGIVALVAGRAMAAFPQPLDILALSAAWIVAWAWALRLNRIAVLFATHFAMMKPLVLAIAAPAGIALDFDAWTWLVFAILAADLLLWLPLHRISRRLDWTLGPGGRKPPLERAGFFWRYWPYATEESLAAWDRSAAERKARREARRAARAARRSSRGARAPLDAPDDPPATDSA